MFSNRTVKKKYLAVTAGVPTYEEGEINIPIGGTKLTGGHRIVIGRELIGKSDEVKLVLYLFFVFFYFLLFFLF